MDSGKIIEIPKIFVTIIEKSKIYSKNYLLQIKIITHSDYLMKTMEYFSIWSINSIVKKNQVYQQNMTWK